MKDFKKTVENALEAIHDLCNHGDCTGDLYERADLMRDRLRRKVSELERQQKEKLTK
jgi:hypothetical protein